MQKQTTVITDSHPIDNILSSLENVIETQKCQYRARCPVHQKPESRKTTLSIKENPDGQVLVHCFAGCHYEEVLDAIGLKKSDLFPDADWLYEKEPNHKSLRQVIDDCKPTATLMQVYVAEMMRPKAWEVIATALHLDKRDLWILKGAADSLREVLDA